MWQPWSFLLVVVGLGLFPELFTWWRYGLAGMPAIDRMSGADFLQYLEGVFRQHGYRVDRTPAVGDQGISFVLAARGERVAVRVEHVSTDVSDQVVEEVSVACRQYRCSRGMVVSNQEFTPGARELAQATQVELYGRRRLAELILSVERTAKEPAVR